jgi:hypothetical protein
MPVAPLLIVEWSSFDLIGYAPNVIYHVSSVSKIYYVTDLTSLFPFQVKENFFLTLNDIFIVFQIDSAVGCSMPITTRHGHQG